MSESIATNLKPDSTIQSQKGSKPSILGTIVLAVLLILLTGILQLILAIPMFYNDMISLDMFELSNAEFFNALSINTLLLFKCLEVIAAIICIHFFLKKEHVNFNSLGFELNGFKTDALLGALAGIVVISACFGLLLSTEQVNITFNSFSLFPWKYAIFFLLVAILEEVLVRGYIQGRLMRATSPIVALLVSSVLFMAMHLGNDYWSLISLINLALAGVTLGIYYMYKQNLWLPIALHFTWNFFQGPVYGFQVSGMNTPSWIEINRTGHELLTGGAFGLEGSVLVTIIELLLITLIYRKYSAKKNQNNTLN